jgi:hypothetical protein
MNHLLRALWDRLLPPGGDAATAREPDNREVLSGFTIAPRRLAEERPRPSDLDLRGQCWWWWGQAWALHAPVDLPSPDALWLPHWAIAHPTTEP